MMKSRDKICGFSKMSREEKLEVLAGLFDRSQDVAAELKSYWHVDPKKQRLFEEFSENTISNFFLPYGISPNFLINRQYYIVPMVIEESSVVAAASASAKFWADRGGFHSEVLSTRKIGQVHFIWHGNVGKLNSAMPALKQELLSGSMPITANMKKRGGGVIDIELVDFTGELENYYQLKVSFETVDSMGANFINSVLEEYARILREFIRKAPEFTGKEKECEVIMSILSNYTPDCLVRTWVECDIKDLGDKSLGMDPEMFAWKIRKAVEIANVDPYRATTHNKGIFNGIDAVALATGNDFRAVEAGAHAFASREGKYRSLSSVSTEGGKFHYELKVPLALGTVGGLTALHPLAKFSLELLGEPTARELMMVASSVGLANNFGALKSLVTRGIQIGHMKMHLLNILNYYHATHEEKQKAIEYFKNQKITFNSVSHFISTIRGVPLIGMES